MRHRLVLLSLISLGWWSLPLVLSPRSGIAWGLPVYAAAVALSLGLWDRARLQSLFQPRLWAVVFGLMGGLLMVVMTYPAYALALRFLPEIADPVAADYARLFDLGTWSFLPRMLVVVLAEELLWRGSWLELPGLPVGWRRALSLGTYVLAQTSVGSWTVIPLTTVCGGVWLAQRELTGGLVAPLLTHAMWSPALLLFFPLQERPF